jgi:hypothetical protein
MQRTPTSSRNRQCGDPPLKSQLFSARFDHKAVRQELWKASPRRAERQQSERTSLIVVSASWLPRGMRRRFALSGL